MISLLSSFSSSMPRQLLMCSNASAASSTFSLSPAIATSLSLVSGDPSTVLRMERHVRKVEVFYSKVTIRFTPTSSSHEEPPQNSSPAHFISRHHFQRGLVFLQLAKSSADSHLPCHSQPRLRAVGRRGI